MKINALILDYVARLQLAVQFCRVQLHCLTERERERESGSDGGKPFTRIAAAVYGNKPSPLHFTSIQNVRQ